MSVLTSILSVLVKEILNVLVSLLSRKDEVVKEVEPELNTIGIEFDPVDKYYRMLD